MKGQINILFAHTIHRLVQKNGFFIGNVGHNRNKRGRTIYLKIKYTQRLSMIPKHDIFGFQ